MVYTVQTLLKPTGAPGLADVPIFMPDELADALQQVFSFDVGGRSELEGDRIFQSMLRFGVSAKENQLCRINFREESLGENGGRLYVLAPIDKAAEVVEFIEDQISEQPRHEAINALRMRDVLLGDVRCSEDIVGWFDLDTPCFIFRDSSTFYKLSCFFDVEEHPNYSRITHIDRILDFQPSVGNLQDDALVMMQRLADVWGKAVSCPWSGKVLEVYPTLEV